MNNFRAVYDIFSKLRTILTPKQKKGVILSLLSMFCASLLELLGISTIYPFLQLIMDEVSFRSKWYINLLSAFFNKIDTTGIIVILCLIIIIVFFVKNSFAIVCVYIQTQYAEKLKRELSTEMLVLSMRRPYEYFVETKTGTIIRNIQNGPSVVSRVIKAFFQFANHLLTSIMISLYLFFIDWKMAVATLLIAGVCFLLIVLCLKKPVKIMGKRQWGIESEKLQSCTQTIGGIKEIIVKDRRSFFTNDYEIIAKKSERINVIYSILSSCPDRIIETICVSAFLGVVCVRLYGNVDIALFVSSLGVFAMGAIKILPSIANMSSDITSVIFEMSALFDFCDSVIDMRSNDLNRYNTIDRECSSGCVNRDTNISNDFMHSVTVKDVSWRYVSSSKNILNNINIEIRRGESIALIGASGAGKTTLSDIILGLYKPQSGSVYVDGIDIFSIPSTWSRMISYVPQSVFLIDDTVRANVAFGIPSDQISDEKVWECLKKAKLENFISDLPRGVDTIVGERGVKLSGGQRQRIAIARALYDDPCIIVLDEATSSLDSETEKGIMESIDSLIGNKTMIIVAHRLSTIKNCDRVYEIVNGLAIERRVSDVISTP